jgi:hypothetical protein
VGCRAVHTHRYEKRVPGHRGHEFQALFHWHVADLGMEHVYIKQPLLFRSTIEVFVGTSVDECYSTSQCPISSRDRQSHARHDGQKSPAQR